MSQMAHDMKRHTPCPNEGAIKSQIAPMPPANSANPANPHNQSENKSARLAEIAGLAGVAAYIWKNQFLPIIMSNRIGGVANGL